MARRRKRKSFERFVEALHDFGKELLCPICLSIFSEPTRLPCNHYFCKNCIEQCMVDDPRCPVCKCTISSESLWFSTQINAIIQCYQDLVAPRDDLRSLSQPLTPSKIKKIMTGQTVSVSLNSPSPIKQSELPTKKPTSSYVFLVTGLNAKQLRLVNHVCTNSSVRIVKDYCDEVTHCITAAYLTPDKSYMTNRTIKYLIAILHHLPIIAFAWIEEIVQVIDDAIAEDQKRRKETALTIDVPTSDFPPWKPYLIRGNLQSEELRLDAPRRSLRSSTLLFEKMHFLVIGAFEQPKPSIEQLKELIQHGGGKVGESSKNAIILIDPPLQNNDQYPEATAVVDFHWLLDSISNYELLPFENYSLLS